MRVVSPRAEGHIGHRVGLLLVAAVAPACGEPTLWNAIDSESAYAERCDRGRLLRPGEDAEHDGLGQAQGPLAAASGAAIPKPLWRQNRILRR